MLPSARSLQLLCTSLAKFGGGLLLLIFLSACSFAPLYGSGSSANIDQPLAFAEPDSRLEQIIFFQLRDSFKESSDLSAPFIDLNVSESGISIGPNSVSLKGTLSIYRRDPTNIDGQKKIYSISRTATATRGTSPQKLADRTASNESAERAARELGESLRISLLGALNELEVRGLLKVPYNQIPDSTAL